MVWRQITPKTENCIVLTVKIILTKANDKNFRDAFRFGHPDFLLFSELSVVDLKNERV